MAYLTSSATNQSTMIGRTPDPYVRPAPRALDSYVTDGNATTWAHQLVRVRDRRGWSDDDLAAALGIDIRQLCTARLSRLEADDAPGIAALARDCRTTSDRLAAVLFAAA